MWLMKYLSRKYFQIGKSISIFLVYYRNLKTYQILGFTKIFLKSPGYARFGLLLGKLPHQLKFLQSLQFFFFYCTVFVTSGLADELILNTYVYCYYKDECVGYTFSPCNVRVSE